jgi:hypothetical protein
MYLVSSADPETEILLLVQVHLVRLAVNPMFKAKRTDHQRRLLLEPLSVVLVLLLFFS